MLCFDERNILLEIQAADCEAVIRMLARRLEETGYVDSGYADAVLAREREYPTGLPTDDVITALPHASYSGIYKTGVAVARLKEPVTFCNMADGSEELPVRLVFLLASASGGDAHLEDLQELMGCFCRMGLLQDLMAVRDAQAFIEVFAKQEQYEEA